MPDAIVVGTDGSPESLAAVEAAARHAADDCIVHVVSAYKAGPVVGGLEVATYVDMRPKADAALERAANRLSALGVLHETHAVNAAPAEALISVAETHDAHMIVVGSRGMHGAKRVLGSVPNTITHKAPCDVLLVRTD